MSLVFLPWRNRKRVLGSWTSLDQSVATTSYSWHCEIGGAKEHIFVALLYPNRFRDHK